MVNFDELDKMINEINNVIADTNKETANIEKDTHKIKENNFVNAINDMVLYCEMLSKATSKSDLSLDFVIPLGKCNVLFSLRDTWDKWSVYGASVFVLSKDEKRIAYPIIENRGGYISAKYYDNINHSHPAISIFENVIKDWENVKESFEVEVVNCVHTILKKKSEIAHEKNIKAKLESEKYN